MDVIDRKLLMVLKGGHFKGLLSAGDIQRAIINDFELSTEVSVILRDKIRVAKPNDSYDSVKGMMIEHRMEFCPVVDHKGVVKDVYFWEDLFGEINPEPMSSFDLPVVIMAGGFGTRLRPLTYVIPKPMIPINDKTMLEEIFSRFGKYGCNRFFISVNYKSDLIKYYLDSQKLPYEIDYFIEEKPMGTAGSMSLLKGKIDTTFFVSNCDILIEQDYSEILKYHREQNNEITLVAALKHYDIPYGTLKTGKDGQLKALEEKPALNFKINSGMYVLEPSLLDEIPKDEFFHITHLIEKIMKRKGKVGVFPVSEKSWKDMGEWSEYSKLLNG
ncbi:MAG: mannose-1-phosphate guanylyltransferase [Cytophagales bacterium CG12_big_fil_rev_8_21_14_0_65_40_12]|nr:MAG: mannose-1-phosphate guanylyltransferase [Cytophagales bacterium CG12_big_fil_rev_8_21_14_0_65_40_12]PIW04279.1 MAG: mannose-1-phosphate guanylyltransferase [Cytophagales bacterium CG17_big_fil_post_rev_8_21_14_2_50_40_13]